MGLGVSAAHGNPWGEVKCDETPDHPECLVTVIDPGGGWTSDGVGDRDPACSIGDHEVPCHDPALGWLHADGCYYSPAPEVGPGPDWWERWCYNPVRDEYFSGGTRHLLGAPTSIENVVQQAVDRLSIPQPDIATNPSNAAQVVHVPVWVVDRHRLVERHPYRHRLHPQPGHHRPGRTHLGDLARR
jgi:hypothetical protein